MRLFDSEKEMNSNSVVLSNVITIEKDKKLKSNFQIDKIIKLSADDNDSLFITTDKELLRIKKLSDGSYSLYTNKNIKNVNDTIVLS